METLIQNLWNQKVDETEARQLFRTLRDCAKNENEKERMQQEIQAHWDCFVTYFGMEDAKARKNLALLCGDLELQKAVDSLMDAYQKETVRFVKSSYLTACSRLDCSSYEHFLKEKMKELQDTVLTEETKKHVQEEQAALSKILQKLSPKLRHTFKDVNGVYRFVLVTNRKNRDVTSEQLVGVKKRDHPLGVLVQEAKIGDVLPIRTYSEVLFVIQEMEQAELNPESASLAVADSKLYETLRKMHKEDGPFRFRVELRSGMMPEKKASFLKRFAGNLEYVTKGRFVNSVSDYEIEIRLYENQSGGVTMFVKLYTIEDQRFAYRKEYLAASIRPEQAATLVYLAKDYLAEDARVLDPFCGVGTMLIERQKFIKGNTSYGIDIYEDAIKKARTNTKLANQIVHYINRDFMTFQHEHVFDEVITNMPFAQGKKTEEEIYAIYQGFFEKIHTHLTRKGNIIMYSHNPVYVEQLALVKQYRILKKWEILPKEGTALYVLTRNI